MSGICVGEIIPTPTELHECEEPEQPKALFRRAKALTALKEHQARCPTGWFFIASGTVASASSKKLLVATS